MQFRACRQWCLQDFDQAEWKKPFELTGPNVSNASGIKVRVLASGWYFSSFRSTAAFAFACLTMDLCKSRWKATRWANTIWSLPICSHETDWVLNWLLLLLLLLLLLALSNHLTSRDQLAPQLPECWCDQACSSRVIRSMGRGIFPALRLQARPCVPNSGSSGLTLARPTANMTALAYKRNPQDE